MKNKKFSNVDDLVTDLLGEKDSHAFVEGMHKHRKETATISELVLNRVKQGLTQCEVARRMGVSPSKVCRMEDSADADLSYEDIQKYSDAIGLRSMIVFETKEQPHDIASFVYSIGTLLEQLKGLLPSSSGFGEKLTNVYGDVLFPIALKSAQTIRRNGVSRIALVVMLSVLSIGAFAESRVDKMLSSYEYFWQKKYHRGNGSLLPVDEQTKCHELALLGGQPVLTRTMQSNIDKWANSNLVKTPRHYKATMPKRALAQDAILKQRQELLLPRTQELRELIIDAYGLSMLYGVGSNDLERISKQYAAMMSSEDWKKIGNRNDDAAFKAAQKLLNSIRKDMLVDVTKVFVLISKERVALHAKYAKMHPESASVANANYRARRAERLAGEAKEAAENAQNMAAEALWRSNNGQDSDVVFPAVSPQRAADTGGLRGR